MFQDLTPLIGVMLVYIALDAEKICANTAKTDLMDFV